MKLMNGELKKVVEQVKSAQAKINQLIQNQDWMDEARKYAEQQGMEVKKLFAEDVSKLRQFLEAERREMDRFQKQIPGEVKKFKNFLKNQRKEFQNLMTQIKNNNLSKGKVLRSSTKTRKSAGTKTQAKMRTKTAGKAKTQTTQAKRSAPKKRPSSRTAAQAAT